MPISIYEQIQNCILSKKPLEESNFSVEIAINDILKDIPRTYLIAGNAKEELQLLNILTAFAYIKPSIGYCQGLNFLAAVLLKVTSSEENSFWLILALIKKWDMENMYVPGVPDLALREFQMDHYVQNLLPDLYTHFRKNEVTNAFFISRWFMTLFATFFSFQALVVIWDCFFNEGWKVIFKVGLAVLIDLKPVIIQFDLEEISKCARSSLPDVDFKKLLKKSAKVKVTNTELKKLEERFYIEQVNVKLRASESALSASEEEISAIRWAKKQFDQFDGVTKNDVEVFQRKIKKLEIEQENHAKHYLMVSMEMIRVQKELEALMEKKELYARVNKDVEKKFKKSKISRFVKKILSKNKPKGETARNAALSQGDIDFCESKLEKIDEEIADLERQHREKSNMCQEALLRSQETNDKKQSYSEQFCIFLKSIKQNR